MNLSTTYMGFELPHPIIPGASPLADDLDTVRRLEDAGAPLIVMRSLFEEQLTREQLAFSRSVESRRESYAESLSYLPEPDEFILGPDDYLEQVRLIKRAVAVPVIGSLNGTTEGGWLAYARLIQQAGADGLELNLYEVAADLHETGEQVEERALRVVRTVKAAVRIPVAVKLSPFYSSPSNFAHKLDLLEVDALVLFNRFYQPDFDIEERTVVPSLSLSSPAEIRLPLLWIALLYGRVKASLAATTGVHSHVEAIKYLMAGADVVMSTSALLQQGPPFLSRLVADVSGWMYRKGYTSVSQLRGSMSQQAISDSSAFVRGNYIRVLESYKRGTN
jgi:dihydroorotate dehydrogenase (fumarate)